MTDKLANRIPFEDIETVQVWTLPSLSDGKTRVVPTGKKQQEKEEKAKQEQEKKAAEEIIEEITEPTIRPLTAEQLAEITEQAEREGREHGYQEGFQQGFAEGEKRVYSKANKKPMRKPKPLWKSRRVVFSKLPMRCWNRSLPKVQNWKTLFWIWRLILPVIYSTAN